LPIFGELVSRGFDCIAYLDIDIGPFRCAMICRLIAAQIARGLSNRVRIAAVASLHVGSISRNSRLGCVSCVCGVTH